MTKQSLYSIIALWVILFVFDVYTTYLNLSNRAFTAGVITFLLTAFTGYMLVKNIFYFKSAV